MIRQQTNIALPATSNTGSYTVATFAHPRILSSTRRSESKYTNNTPSTRSTARLQVPARQQLIPDSDRCHPTQILTRTLSALESARVDMSVEDHARTDT